MSQQSHGDQSWSGRGGSENFFQEGLLGKNPQKWYGGERGLLGQEVCFVVAVFTLDCGNIRAWHV